MLTIESKQRESCPQGVSALLAPVLCLLLLISMLISTSGCYPDWPEHSGTAQVEGEVFLDGFPLNKANVVFVPSKLKSASGKLMPLVYGTSDARGMFKMNHLDGSRDVMAGTYHVLISLIDSKSSGSSEKATESGFEPFKPTDGKHSFSFLLVNKMIAEADSGPVGRAELLRQIDRHQVVPAFYNRESNLKYEVIASPGIVRTKFELFSIDPLLEK